MAFRQRMPRWKKEAAKSSRYRPTPSEAKMWDELRDRQVCGLKFRRQAPMLGYIADFWCPELKLVVEVDGGYHAERQEEDDFRDKVMREHGLTVIRISADLVMSDILAALDPIADAYAERALRDAA